MGNFKNENDMQAKTVAENLPLPEGYEYRNYFAGASRRSTFKDDPSAKSKIRCFTKNTIGSPSISIDTKSPVIGCGVFGEFGSDALNDSESLISAFDSSVNLMVQIVSTGNPLNVVNEVQTVAPETTDLPIIYWESMKEVLAAFQKAIIIALITITLLLYAIRRNFTDTFLVMTPLILAGLFTMASTVLTHTPINYANIIALPLLLGLGVDNGIHMV